VLLFTTSSLAAITLKQNGVTRLFAGEGVEGWGLNNLSEVGSDGIVWKGTSQYIWRVTAAQTAEYYVDILNSVPSQGHGVAMAVSSEGVSQQSDFTLEQTNSYVASENPKYERRRLPKPIQVSAGPDTWIGLESKNVSSGSVVFNFRGIELTPVAIDSAVKADQLKARASRADISWMQNGVYGGGFHWTSESVDQKGITHNFTDLVDGFDVKKFADNAEAMGLGYVLFTFSHAYPFSPAPIQSWANIHGASSVTQRDLIMEIADALEKKNIPLMLYIPTHVMTDAWINRVTGNWHWNTDLSSQVFQDRAEETLTEIGTRYGDKVKGYWFDCWYQLTQVYNDIDYERFYKACKVGNPNRAVGLNAWILPTVSEWQDYWTGEVYNIPSVAEQSINDYGPAKGLPLHNWVAMEEGWVLQSTSIKMNLDRQNLTDYIKASQKSHIPVTINLLIYADGSIVQQSFDNMVYVKNNIRTDTLSITDSLVINNTNSAFKYNGSWFLNSNRGAGDYNDDVHNTSTNGDYCEIVFTGTSIEYVTEKNSDQGEVEIYIDNKLVSTVDCSNSSRLTQQAVFRTTFAAGVHTFRAVKKSGMYMLIDALRIKNEKPVGTAMRSKKSSNLPVVHIMRAGGKLCITMDNIPSGSAVLKIFKPNGCLVRELNTNVSRTLDLSFLPEGVYLYSVLSARGLLTKSIMRVMK
jgi:hypothetical protein